MPTAGKDDESPLKGGTMKSYPSDFDVVHLCWHQKRTLCKDIISAAKYCGELILETIQAASTFAISDRDAFLEKVRSASQLRQAGSHQGNKRKLNKGKSSFRELDTIIRSSADPLPSGALPASGSTACWRNMRRSKR